MKKQNIRTLSLIVVTFTYLLVGAAIFDALESETEKKRWEALQAVEDMIIKKYRVSSDDYKIIETVILKTEPHKAGKQWKFTGAFYYVLTVLTTIGYGHSTPTTVYGKLFTMCYAMVGIPLGLVMFQSIGERVNRLSSFVIQNVKKSLKCRKTAATELNLICVVTTLSSLTIAGGAAAFSKFENWKYFDSVYYCFITLTTIGFGDMVALQKDESLTKRPEYVIFALVFILFGLAIVAASLNLLVLRFVTMNTEDERRDEAQAILTLQGAVRLDGDVITANGSILSGHLGHRIDPNIVNCPQLQISGSTESFEGNESSCSCGCFRASRHERYHVKKTTPFYIQPLPGPRYDFRNNNKSNLNKFSISTSSLPPVGLFSTEDKSEKLPALTHIYNFHSDEELREEFCNLTDIDDIVEGEKRHHSLEYLDDFYPIEEHHYFDDILDDETSEPHQQMTTTTTVASFRNSQSKSHITTGHTLQSHNRASSL